MVEAPPGGERKGGVRMGMGQREHGPTRAWANESMGDVSNGDRREDRCGSPRQGWAWSWGSGCGLGCGRHQMDRCATSANLKPWRAAFASTHLGPGHRRERDTRSRLSQAAGQGASWMRDAAGSPERRAVRGRTGLRRGASWSACSAALSYQSSRRQTSQARSDTSRGCTHRGPGNGEAGKT